MIPALKEVPSSVGNDLLIKATSSGIVFLKDGRFRSRYTGNKYSAVDINGNLWLKKSDLLKEIKPLVVSYAKKKPAPVETGAVHNNFVLIPEQISENLSTHDGDFLPHANNLSTKEIKTYRINKKEVRQRILGYLNTQKGKRELYFWTISFPKNTQDATAYAAFNIWLTRLRTLKMLREYIWVAERQENGTIHFHMAIPHRMSVQGANGLMRTTLKRYCETGEIPYKALALRGYNGVDIAKNRKTGRVTNFAVKKGARSLVTYLTKYVTKNDTAFTHLAWHNSRGYSSIFTGVTFTISEFKANGFYPKLYWAKKFEGEFFVFVPWFGEPPDKLMDCLYQLNTYVQGRMDGTLSGPPVVATSAVYLRGDTAFINSYKIFKDMRTEQIRMTTGEAERVMKHNEYKMVKAFTEFSFCYQEFDKKFCDEMRQEIVTAVEGLEMQKEFNDLLFLINKEHREKKYFFTYALYCYWAVDLLNQIIE